MVETYSKEVYPGYVVAHGLTDKNCDGVYLAQIDGVEQVKEEGKITVGKNRITLFKGD